MSFTRIYSLLIKEFLDILRDPRGRFILIVPPLVQLIIFSNAATLDVKNISVLILNEDAGIHSHELVQRISGSKSFQKIIFTHRHDNFKSMIDQQQIIAAIHFPANFSRNLEAGGSTNFQVVFDGRKSNAAQISATYIGQIVDIYNAELLKEKYGMTPRLTIEERYWFNENLEYNWFTIPSLIGLLTMIMTLSLTAMAVAREKELGTFEQLRVSPLTPEEILIGKVIPAMLIGILEGLFIFVIGWLLFKVPFNGSLLLLLASTCLFAFSIVGTGLFISALSKTQQQAILGAFAFMVPATALSGFAAPIENMPQWLQQAIWINPMKHAMVIFRGIYLKNMSFTEVAHNAWPLFIIGIITLTAAGLLFRSKLE